jgi:N utilization substance protein B
VIENNSLLEEKLINFLDKKFDLKNFEIIFSIILKSAIYEIFFYKKTPFKVVIDEHLKITKMFLNDKQKNIINAVLDKIAKSV